MKFTTTPVKAPAKVFDMAAAEEALADSFDRLTSATEALAAVNSECDRYLSVVEDCHTAIEAFNQFGDKSLGTVLAICNGSTGALDQALGLESLAIDTLKTMDAAKTKVVKDKYVTALEANVGEAMKAFYEKCKVWLAKFIEWVKDLFTSNAKLIKLVQEVKFDNLDEEAQMSGLKAENAVKLAAVLEGASAVIKSVLLADDTKDAIIEANDKFSGEVAELTKREDGTVKELGWDAAKADALAKKFPGLANKKEIQELTQKIGGSMKVDLQASKDGDVTAVEKLRTMFAAAVLKNKYVGTYTKGVRALGLHLLKLAKKTKKVEMPAEPAK